MEKNRERSTGRKERFLKFREGMIASLPISIDTYRWRWLGLLAKSTGLSLLEHFFLPWYLPVPASLWPYIFFKEVQTQLKLLWQLSSWTRHFHELTPVLFLPLKEESWLFLLSFGITDESFAYLSTSPTFKGVNFVLGLSIRLMPAGWEEPWWAIYLVIFYSYYSSQYGNSTLCSFVLSHPWN